MITYVYECFNDKCKHTFEIEQSIKDDSLTKCPKCKHITLERIIQPPLLLAIKVEPKTVGHLAARNTEKMGSIEYEDKIAKRKERVQKASDKFLEKTGGRNVEKNSELPWYRSGKMEGLPKREKPLTIQEAEKVAKEMGIKIKEPKGKPQNGKR